MVFWFKGYIKKLRIPPCHDSYLGWGMMNFLFAAISVNKKSQYFVDEHNYGFWFLAREMQRMARKK